MKFKANQIYLNKKKNSRCDVHTLPKKLIAKRLYVWLQFWVGLVCFHPSHTQVMNILKQILSLMNLVRGNREGVNSSYLHIKGLWIVCYFLSRVIWRRGRMAIEMCVTSTKWKGHHNERILICLKRLIYFCWSFNICF